MKKTLLFLASVALAGVAAAQENPAKLALAREVIAVMKVDQMFDSMAAQMKLSASQMTKLPPTATPEQIAQVEVLRNKIMDACMESAKGMVGKTDHLYAEIYTEEELTAMKSFFTSTVGQSMLAKQPQIMARLMPMVQEMQRDLMPKVKQMIEDAKLPKFGPPMAAPAAGPAPAPAAENKPFEVKPLK